MNMQQYWDTPSPQITWHYAFINHKQRGADGSQDTVHSEPSAPETQKAGCSEDISKWHRSHRVTINCLTNLLNLPDFIHSYETAGPANRSAEDLKTLGCPGSFLGLWEFRLLKQLCDISVTRRWTGGFRDHSTQHVSWQLQEGRLRWSRRKSYKKLPNMHYAPAAYLG